MPLLLLAACTDQESPTTPGPGPDPSFMPLGVYEFAVTGITGETPSATATYVAPPGQAPGMGAPGSLGVVTGPLNLEEVTTTSATEGGRQHGQRYVSVTYRVRNFTGRPVSNVTFIPVTNANTKSKTPFLQMLRFDGAQVDTMVMRRTVPSGVVVLGNDLELQSPLTDVVQVFTEPEVAAIPLDSTLTGIFPYGFVVRSRASTVNRTLPATSDPNQWDGLLTLSVRIPLQPNDPGTQNGPTKDAFSFRLRMLAVEDSEVRLTETIEEGQDPAAVTRLQARATALGATTVTVLAGSPRLAPEVLDYPGQRLVCSVRTAGTADSVVTRITTQGDYVQVLMMRPGEDFDQCSPNFIGGTPARPATNVPFQVRAVAADRYGHRVPVADSIYFQVSGAPANPIPPVKFTDGDGLTSVTFTDYGNASLRAVDRRQFGTRPIPVLGVTRTWTAGAATTNWHTNANWSPAAVPMPLDSVVVPAASPLFPDLLANVSVQGVTVQDVATLNLGAFDLTAGGDVSAGLTGGITSTTGRLQLTGIAKTVQGRLPRLRVTGTYNLTGNVTSRAPVEVAGGRLTGATGIGFRLQAESF